MIAVTRMNGERFWVNPDLIQFIDETPGTVVTLVDGLKVRVVESAETIQSAVTSYRASVIAVATHITRPEPGRADWTGVR